MFTREVIIGIDFDNTIVCYDDIFYKLALEKGLICQKTAKSKQAVRDVLRSQGMEEVWTEMQGDIYGKRMIEAEPFLGVKAFIAKMKGFDIPLYIVSHKTQYPYMGPKYDLHKVARDWLKKWGFFEILNENDVYFEPSKDAKIARIVQLSCNHFFDDLPEFLLEQSFPKGVKKYLFDPLKASKEKSILEHFSSWHEMREMWSASLA